MKLSEFCAKFHLSIEGVIVYSGRDAIKAVENDGFALQYVKEQTPDICIKAVENDGDALRYVKEQTPDICIKAVERNGFALRYVKEQTPDICIKAVERNGFALRYVNPSIFDAEDTVLEQPEEIEVDGVKYRRVA